MAELLSVAETERRVAELDRGRGRWSVDGSALVASFRFRDFVEAFAFMTAAALVAERLDHHPEWSNVYRTVDVRLTTHDAGGITTLDFRLAEAMDAAAGA
jgi:4a-hydroxytetrahydrobiopterin dehydratase